MPAEVTAAVNQWARQLQVAADGTVLRSVLSWSQQNEQAIELFDRVLVPERRRPTAEAFARDHFDVLADLVRDAPPFRVAVAADPSGASFGMRVPAALEQAPFGSQLQDAIQELLSSALQQPWQATGLPTGLVAEFDGRHVDSRLVFDNLVDSGAFDPDSRQASHRTAPHAWDSITVSAAARDPRFQPDWVSQAVEILRAGGHDVPVNHATTATPAALASDPPGSPHPRRISRWFRRRSP